VAITTTETETVAITTTETVRTTSVVTVKRRVPVQDHVCRGRPAGSITWAEHEAIWEIYAARYGRGESAERIAERGGFGHAGIIHITGAPPKTWENR